MKIQVLSDLHCEFEKPGSTMTAERYDVQQRMLNADAGIVILAGDTHTRGRGPGTAFERFKGKEIVMISGNHEYYGDIYPAHLEELQKKASLFKNVYFLENQAVEIDDVVFLGCTLWTDFKLWESGPFAGLFSRFEALQVAGACMNDYRKIIYSNGGKYRSLLPNDTIQIHCDSVRWLREQFEIHRGKKVVVVTHTGPSFKSVATLYKKDVLSAAFASHLDDLVEQSGALLWIHGHSHEPCDYMIGKTRVLANPHGYPFEGKEFIPDLVLEM